MRVGSSRRAAPTDTGNITRPMSGGVIGAPPEFGTAPAQAPNEPPPPAEVVPPVDLVAVAPPSPPPPPSPLPPPPHVAVPPAGSPPDELVEETIYAPRRAAGSRWRLALASGKDIEISTRAVAGRAPSAPAGWEGATLVVIDDPDRTVSKTHAGFAVEGDTVFVTDLGSTNGVAIVNPDGTELVLEPGVAVAIPDGADVELGSFAVRITRA